jgi:hypothetical protein
VALVVKKRLTSFILLLVLFGGALAGVPLRFGESNCSMGGMMDMDCCKAALLQKQSTKVSEAELLCALNCAQNGTTLPTGVVRINPPAQTIEPPHATLTQPLSLPFSSSVANAHINSPPGSPPKYLRNLALLI